MSIRERINAAMTNFADEKRSMNDHMERLKNQRLKSEAGRHLLQNFQNYILFETIDDANNWALKVLNELNERATQQVETSPKPLYIGVHVGWNMCGKKREKSTTQLISISVPNQPVACLSLCSMGVRDHTNFPEHVRTLLQLPYVKACGINIHRFLSRIKRYFHIIVPIRIELDKMAMIIEPESIKEEMRSHTDGYLDIFAVETKKKLPSTKVLCSKYLNVVTDGEFGNPYNIDYFQDPLPAEIIKFSTLEAYHFRYLGEVMMDILQNDITLRQPSTKFQVGTKVKVYIGSKFDHVAEGVIEYLGGVNGESVSFGEKMICKGMCLVRIMEVFEWEKNPKYSKETFMLYGFDLARQLTLRFVLLSKLPLIAIDLKRLVRLDEVDTNLYVEKPKIKKASPRKLKKKRVRGKKIRKWLEKRQEKHKDLYDYESKSVSKYWNF